MDFAAHLRNLRTDYLSGKPVKCMQFDLLTDCTWTQQADLLQHTVNASVVTHERRNLSRAYRSAFLRHIVTLLERQAIEVHDDIYTELAASLVTNPDDDESYAWKHFDLWRANAEAQQTPPIISVRQKLSIISDGTTGLHTWQAAGALAEWAIANAALLRGRAVLELGSGTGLTGLVVARMCAPKRLALTDGNERVVELLRQNVAANGLACAGEDDDEKGSLLVRVLDWEAVDESGICAQIVPDVILAADVVYDDTLFAPLCTALDALFRLAAPDCCAYLAATVRNSETLGQFLQQLGACRFQHTELLDMPAPHVLHWDDSTPIKIFRITRGCDDAMQV